MPFAWWVPIEFEARLDFDSGSKLLKFSMVNYGLCDIGVFSIFLLHPIQFINKLSASFFMASHACN
jgi:hypothetical protein